VTEEPGQLNGSTITASILPLFGIRPVIRRGFRDDEEQPGSAPVAMISEGTMAPTAAAPLARAGVAGRSLTAHGPDDPG
jgi:hypothetical protein